MSKYGILYVLLSGYTPAAILGERGVLCVVRVRETKLSDYGFSRTEETQLRKFCRQLDTADEILLLECCMKINASIGRDLYYTIASGISFDKLGYVKDIMIPQTDFYGYQRKVLATFKKMLVELGKYPVKDEYSRK